MFGKMSPGAVPGRKLEESRAGAGGRSSTTRSHRWVQGWEGGLDRAADSFGKR